MDPLQQIQDVSATVYADLFPSTGGGQTGKVKFGAEESSVDLFPSSVQETTTSSSVDETTTVSSSTDETTTVISSEVDILSKEKKVETASQKPLDGLSSYYQERVKNGKLLAIKVDGEDGKEIDFLPKTAEEFDEVLELQWEHKLQTERKNIEKSWYESKPPAWKAVAQYAELVDDPTELIPFLEGVKTIQSVSKIDENEIDGAEQIVRVRMEQRGDPEETITSQIEALKSTDKLIATAKQYKPIILQEEQQILQQQVQYEREMQAKYMKDIENIRSTAVQAIEKPIFGKQVLTRDEKAAVYELIAVPQEQTQGYGIYSAIDNLFQKRDAESMETLKQIALFLAKKDSFLSYLGTSVANTTAANLQGKLRIAGDKNNSGNSVNVDEEREVIKRNQFSKTPRFGM